MGSLLSIIPSTHQGQKESFLGAGSSNEAVMALLQKVPEISAVEIDPAIADLGRELHPQRPYRHPHVNVFVEDARSLSGKE
jgi:spermidine synthase